MFLEAQAREVEARGLSFDFWLGGDRGGHGMVRFAALALVRWLWRRGEWGRGEEGEVKLGSEGGSTMYNVQCTM